MGLRPTDLAAEILAHTLVTAAIVHLLVRRLPILDPTSRLAHRVATLVLPLLLAPALALAAPFRASQEFLDVALFASIRWQRVTILGWGVRDAGLALLSVVSLALLARDLLRLAAQWRRDAAHTAFERRATAEHVPPLLSRVQHLARDLSIAPPELLLLEEPGPLLHLRGTRRPVLVAGRPFLDRLPPDQVDAALAHELAHLRHHDVAWTWVLLALRLLHWFNPVAQVVARRASQELEWRADDEARRVTGQALALARALLASMRGRDGEFLGVLGAGRVRAVEERCRRLLQPPAPPPGLSLTVDVGTVMCGIAALLFFVS